MKKQALYAPYQKEDKAKPHTSNLGNKTLTINQSKNMDTVKKRGPDEPLVITQTANYMKVSLSPISASEISMPENSSPYAF